MAEMKGKIPKGMGVDEWVESLAEPYRSVVRELRKIVRKTAPKAREVVKWGWPWYEINGPIAAIMVAGDHVNLELYRGADLKPSRVPLEGTGKTMRHLKIREVAEIKALPIAGLIKEAVAFDAAGKSA